MLLAVAPVGDALERAADLGWRVRAAIDPDGDLAVAWSSAVGRGVSHVFADDRPRAGAAAPIWPSRSALLAHALRGAAPAAARRRRPGGWLLGAIVLVGRSCSPPATSPAASACPPSR